MTLCQIHHVILHHRRFTAQDRLKLLFDFALVLGQAVKRGKSRGDFEKCWTIFCAGVAIEIQVEHRQRRDEIEGSVNVAT
jgi:hypothetical protein